MTMLLETMLNNKYRVGMRITRIYDTNASLGGSRVEKQKFEFSLTYFSIRIFIPLFQKNFFELIQILCFVILQV